MTSWNGHLKRIPNHDDVISWTLRTHPKLWWRHDIRTCFHFTVQWCQLTVMAYQITCNPSVCSTFYWDLHQSNIIITHAPVCISDFRGVRVRYVKHTGQRLSDGNAQVKGQQPLLHSFVYLSVWHHNGATMATTCCNHSDHLTSQQLGTKSNRLFYQVSSIHLIQYAELIPNLKWKQIHISWNECIYFIHLKHVW